MEENRILKLVLTGGPCAGKSSAMTRIVFDLRQAGYTPIVVPEAATLLLNAGFVIAKMGVCAFQSTLLQLQLEQERLYLQGALQLPLQSRPILLCDRGTLDGKAYMTAQQYADMLASFSLQEEALCRSYHAVFHMETVARTYPRAYSNANNAIRYEAQAEAVEVDARLQQIWSVHPNYHFVKAYTTFSEKYQSLRKSLFSVLKEQIGKEENTKEGALL